MTDAPSGKIIDISNSDLTFPLSNSCSALLECFPESMNPQGEPNVRCDSDLHGRISFPFRRLWLETQFIECAWLERNNHKINFEPMEPLEGHRSSGFIVPFRFQYGHWVDLILLKRWVPPIGQWRVILRSSADFIDTSASALWGLFHLVSSSMICRFNGLETWL